MRAVMDGLGVDARGHLTLGGVSVPGLAKEYGTPLYLLDEGSVRNACRAVNQGLSGYPAPYMAAFASKALCFKALYGVLSEEGMGADVVSGGELLTALRGGFNPGRIYFHGNNKTEEELRFALDSKVRQIVVDNAEELALLARAARDMGVTQEIAIRVKPGVDAHTHKHVTTGTLDSKFGVSRENGELADILKLVASHENLRVVGIHCHIGSQIFEREPYRQAAKVMVKLMDGVRRETGLPLRELNLGGGFAVNYMPDDRAESLRGMAAFCAESVLNAAKELDMPPPELVLEPGRSVTGPAGMTVYTVGSVKKIPGLNTYVAVDGGMTDNPRYALYGARYMPILPERPEEPSAGTVIIAGRCCETGDLVTKDAPLPEVQAGDLLAIQATGAFNYSMASHYNRVPNAPVVMVSNGAHRLVVRRETYEDVMRNDL